MSFQPPKETPLLPGCKLGRYTLLYPLAQGGMGTVWAARAPGAGRGLQLFAVKVILPTLASDPKFRAMFLDEARIASAIDHPNVARILDLGEQDETLYLVMEYVEGDSLARLHKQAIAHGSRLLPPALVVRLIADACAGLHAAHELRDRSGALLDVVHRDVSPQNILVSVAGVPMIVDFGIAKARGRLSGDTSTGGVKGKLCYMPREQALGARVDRRADIWAMGSVLYYLLSGKHVFAEANDTAVLHALTSGAPIPPLPPSTPREVAAVVSRALAHEPRERYATAAQMQQALEAAMGRCELSASTRDVAAGIACWLDPIVLARSDALERAAAAVDEQHSLLAALGQSGAPPDDDAIPTRLLPPLHAAPTPPPAPATRTIPPSARAARPAAPAALPASVDDATLTPRLITDFASIDSGSHTNTRRVSRRRSVVAVFTAAAFSLVVLAVAVGIMSSPTSRAAGALVAAGVRAPSAADLAGVPVVEAAPAPAEAAPQRVHVDDVEPDATTPAGAAVPSPAPGGQRRGDQASAASSAAASAPARGAAPSSRPARKPSKQGSPVPMTLFRTRQ